MVAAVPRDGYGTVPLDAAAARNGGTRRLMQGVALACLVAALGVVTLARVGLQAGRAPHRTELSVYQNRYEDVATQGGDWMQCLKWVLRRGMKSLPIMTL